MRGEIKVLKDGFGFIRGEDGVDYFFHKSCMTEDGPIAFEQLRQRQAVTFTPGESLRGPRAEDVAAIARR